MPVDSREHIVDKGCHPVHWVFSLSEELEAALETSHLVIFSTKRRIRCCHEKEEKDGRRIREIFTECSVYAWTILCSLLLLYS